MSAVATDQIKRKPVPSASSPPQDIDVLDILDDYFDDWNGANDLKQKVGELSLEERPALPPRPNTIPLVPTIPPTDTITRTDTTIYDAPNASKSFWKNAVDETVYFAGGLISRPVETTKHFSILRHSSAVVYYKGPSTRVVITIFSDTPLPQERTLWLQRKGFSGNLGMNVSTMLGTSSNWIDVTPSSEALPSEMPESDERVWQRDINRFLKKGTKHVACETCIIRIPASAADGYLRIVLCAGETRKKVLCPSPVFRIASTSADVSVLRGASLSTLPLEAGLKVASIVGTTVANRYVGPARAVVENRVQKYTSKYKPGLIAGHAEHIALAKSGLQTRFEALEQNFEHIRDASYDPLHPPLLSDTPPEVVGPDSGPQKPFPMKLSGTVVQGIGQSQAQLGIPTANLIRVPGDQLLRLNGIYIGWACIEPKKAQEGIFLEWHEAIIIIGPSSGASPRIITKNAAVVHIIHDFDGLTFFGARLKTILMAYLRPVPQPAQLRQSAHVAEALDHDINVALASLSRQSWGAQSTRDRMKAEKAARSMADRYIETRSQVQKGIDSIPFHLAGVRTEGAAAMDTAHGRGGLYIRR